MDRPLTPAERTPLLTEAGEKRLLWLREHESAPRYNRECGDRLTASMDGREQAPIGSCESLIGIANHEPREQPVEAFMLLDWTPSQLGARPQLAHHMNGHTEDLAVIDRLERFECWPRTLTRKLPLHVNQQRAVEMRHRTTARAGCLRRS